MPALPRLTTLNQSEKEPVMGELDKADSILADDSVHVVEEDNITPPPHYRPDGAPQVVTSDTARQGPRGTRVFYVLAGGLVAVVVAGIVIAAFFGHGL
jgi:hypothetical protein